MAKTKIVANYLRKAINEDGNLEVTFEVSNYHYKRYCQDLQKKPYTLEIAEVKNKRSINQNNYLWAAPAAAVSSCHPMKHEVKSPVPFRVKLKLISRLIPFQDFFIFSYCIPVHIA